MLSVHSRQAGFTLIELMIVVFIIGMGASFAILSVAPNQQNLLQEQTEEFVTAARFVAEEAALTYEIIGLFVAPGENLEGNRWGYKWQPLRHNPGKPVPPPIPA